MTLLKKVESSFSSNSPLSSLLVDSLKIAFARSSSFFALCMYSLLRPESILVRLHYQLVVNVRVEEQLVIPEYLPCEVLFLAQKHFDEVVKGYVMLVYVDGARQLYVAEMRLYLFLVAIAGKEAYVKV